MSELKNLEKDKRKAISQSQWREAAASCNYMGTELERLGQFEEALENHKEELGFYEMVDDKIGMGIANRRIGECYTLMNDYEKAFRHIKKFLDIAVSIENKIEEQRAWATLGRTFFLKQCSEAEAKESKFQILKTLDKAEHAFVQALELTEVIKTQLNNKEFAEMKARILLNLGLVLDARDDILQCAENIRQAIFLASKFDLYEVLHRCQTSLASVYQKHGQNSHALRLLDKAILSAEKLRDKTLLCDALSTKANILVMLKDFEGGKNLLKRAYKVHSPIEEDHTKIVKQLKICVGLCVAQTKLQKLDPDEKYERKSLLEKIADGLSSLGCFKLAIEYYLLTLKFMEENDYSAIQKAPIYFSIAATYHDEGDLDKAVEYLKLELSCNENKPQEKVKTLWKMAEFLREKRDAQTEEEMLLGALSTAEEIKEEHLEASTLQKLFSFYDRNTMTEKAQKIQLKLEGSSFQDLSSDESEVEEDTQDVFGDIRLSELSELSEDELENEENTSRSKRRPRKLVYKVNEKGESPLQQACINGNLTVVRRLIESGSDVNIRDNCGWTPLHEACNHGFYDIVEYLLDNGANIHDRGGELCEGVTPLHDAASCGCFDIIKLLISRGASVTVCNNDGETPLQSLMAWKTRKENEDGQDLDPETLHEYYKMVERIQTMMSQAGQPIIKDVKDTSSMHSPNELNVHAFSVQSNRQTEKRARSRSSSTDCTSEDEDSDLIAPYLNADQEKNWDDAEQVHSEYRAVMSSLRRRARSAPHEKKSSPKQEMKKALINESDYVDDWLIKDTNQPQRTQKKRRKMPRLNVRTSKSICNYLTSRDDAPSPHSTDNESLIIDNNDNVAPQLPNRDSQTIETRQNSESTVSQRMQSDSSKLFCLKVRITDKLILVPVPDDLCSVAWLAEQAAQRYQDLVGSRPHLTLMTKDGALLSSIDPVKSLFSNNEEVIASIEFWDEPSLVERYEQLCNKRNIKALVSVKKRLSCFDTNGELSFSSCSLPNVQINVIFLSLSHYKNLQHLDLSETLITDNNSSHIINCFSSFVSLVSLNMSCCGLSITTIKSIAELFQSQNNSGHILPNLKELNLSYNVFHSNCSSYFSVILQLPSLTVINLRSCNLIPSFFQNEVLCQTLQTCHNLQEFNIAGNTQSDQSVQAFLHSLPKSNLKRLDLSHVITKNPYFGEQISSFLSEGLSQLKEICLEDCHLGNTDLVLLAVSSRHCPQLVSCNVSANPELSASDICCFLQTLSANDSSVTDISMAGTCEWDTLSVLALIQSINNRNMKHVSLDHIPESLQEKLIQSWKNNWGSQAMCLASNFCELSIV